MAKEKIPTNSISICCLTFPTFPINFILIPYGIFPILIHISSNGHRLPYNGAWYD
jgi:hypothetical protein